MVLSTNHPISSIGFQVTLEHFHSLDKRHQVFYSIESHTLDNIKMLLDRYFLQRRLGCLPTEGCDVTTEKSQGRLFLMWNFGM